MNSLTNFPWLDPISIGCIVVIVILLVALYLTKPNDTVRSVFGFDSDGDNDEH